MINRIVRGKITPNIHYVCSQSNSQNMKNITLFFTLLVAGVMFAQNGMSVRNSSGVLIVINEIDADQASVDTLEFIEIYSDGTSASLNGLVVVLFNGSDDASYNAIDLDGFATDSNGYFIIGGDAVPGVDIALGADNVIQNGADAVGIFVGDAIDYPTDTPATEVNLQTAIVYGTSDSDDVDLLAALGETVQYDENINGMKDVESIQRGADGSYCVGAPTPRAANIDCTVTCDLSVFVTSVVCDAVTAGTDTYTTTLGFSGGNTGATYTIMSTEGVISGDNPNTTADGSIIISNVDEGVDFTYTVTSTNCDISNAISAVTCEPASVVNNLAELRAGVIGQEYTVSGEVIITFLQDFRNQKFIEDATAAILIDDNAGNLTTTYAIGDGLTNVSGVLGEFNGMMQFVVNADAGAATSTNNPTLSQNILVSELVANPNDYESELVTLDIFDIDTSVNTEWVTGAEYLMLENGSGDEFSFRTTFFDADYIGLAVTTETIITGIITERDNGSYYITSRSMGDFATAGISENNIEGFTITPNPASSQATFSTIASEILNVAIYDVAGKQVMNIVNAQGTINVSDLATGLYIVRATENGQASIAKLVIK